MQYAGWTLNKRTSHHSWPARPWLDLRISRPRRICKRGQTSVLPRCKSVRPVKRASKKGCTQDRELAYGRLSNGEFGQAERCRRIEQNTGERIMKSERWHASVAGVCCSAAALDDAGGDQAGFKQANHGQQEHDHAAGIGRRHDGGKNRHDEDDMPAIVGHVGG